MMRRPLFLRLTPWLVAAVLAVSCRRQASAPEDPQAAAEQAQRYQEMIARAEKKAREGRPEEKLAAAIQTFQQEVGRVPTNLTELVAVGVLPELPKAPPGRAFVYAPDKGRLLMVPAPDRPQAPQGAKGGQPYIP